MTLSRRLSIAGGLQEGRTHPNSLVAREAAKAEEMAARLAEAYARGREDERTEASAEASELRAADRIAAEDQAAAERNAFQVHEYARLEATLRASLGEIGETVGAAVTRILTPFLATQVVKRAGDELRENIARLCSGKPPGMIRISGPERVLSLLRERVTDLPVEVEFVETERVEAMVEAGPTQIATELRPWAELLASLDS